MQILFGMLKRIRHSVGRMVQETGINLEQHGSRISKDISYLEPLSRHRNVMSIYDSIPEIEVNSYISANCSIIGEVLIGSNSAISFGANLKGDSHPIRIGSNTLIGENCSLNCSSNLPVGVPLSVNIGNNVNVGSMTTIISSIVDDNVTIGHKCVLAEGSSIMRNSVLASNSYVPPAFQIPEGQLWAGSPCKFVRDLTQHEIQDNLIANSQQIAQINHHYTDFNQLSVNALN